MRSGATGERRKAIAMEDGVPSYMMMTDAQMAEAVKDGNPTLEILKKIEGFGSARLAKYGGALVLFRYSATMTDML